MTEFAQQYKSKNVLVIGASGFVGRWICRLLTMSGATLWMVSRNLDKLDSICRNYEIKGNYIEADLLNGREVKNVFLQSRPAITFNASGYGINRTEKDEYLMKKINSDLARNIARAISLSEKDPGWGGQDLVHTGSAFEFGPLQGTIPDSATPEPTTLYGHTKLEATNTIEEICRKGNINAIVARLCTVYGAGEYSTRLLPTLMRAANDNTVVEFTEGKQKRDFTCIQDVSEGLLRLGAIKRNGCTKVNLCTGKLHSVREFIDIAAHVLNIPSENIRMGALPGRSDEVHQGVLDIKFLQQLTGWKPESDISTGILLTKKSPTETCREL